MAMRSFVVIGLGTFGAQTARQLYAGGASVLAIDKMELEVDMIANHVTRAVAADATNEEVLGKLGAFDCDVAIVALRRHFDVTVLVTHMLKRNGMDEILVQVDSDKESSAIRAVGASQVIFPEKDMAETLARRLLVPDLADQIPLGEDCGVIELPVPEAFIGKSLIELDVRRNHAVNVIAVKLPPDDRSKKPKVQLNPPPGQPLPRGAVLMVLGDSRSLTRMKEAVAARPAAGEERS
ncbi:MAG: TrkA family potassium uptake protein [Candidatus Sumerlaeia bacterium]|nr:TrkA family potassium uptake protein [Candidatus Sumerlaeia bacterium]